MLFVHSMPIKARGNPSTLKHFEEDLRPHLGHNTQQCLLWYALAQHLAFVSLAIVLSLLLIDGTRNIFFVGLEIAILSATAVILFGHIVPGVLLKHTSGRWMMTLLPFALLISWVARPFALLVNFVSSIAELSTANPKREETPNTAEDIEALLNAGEEEGLIGQEDRKLIQSVVEFGDKTVREVVTPRPRVVAIEANQTVEKLWQLLIDKEHSRVPVFEDEIDNIVGLVHTRDTLDIDESHSRIVTVRELMRPITLVPETKLINELLREMQDANAQMSIVIDEYGQTAGLVTMEDLMEEIVGEIHDESDTPSDVVQQPDKSFILDGNVDLDRLEELIGFRPNEEIESTTVGGLVCEKLGKVPAPGAKISIGEIQIEVLSGDKRKVSSIAIRRISEKVTPSLELRENASPNEIEDEATK